MRFFRFGTGRTPLVVLPGLSVQSVMNSAEIVAHAYSKMSSDFSFYVFDRRENLPPVYTVADMANDTAVAMEQLSLCNVMLFGASQGGMIAMQLAIDHPDLVKKLALGSTSAFVCGEALEVIRNWAKLAKEKDAAGLYLDFGERIYPSAVFAKYQNALRTMARTVTDAELERFVILAEGTQGFCVLDDLQRLHCPVLILGSKDDRVLGAEASLEIANHLPEQTAATLHLYEGYGHAAYDLAPDYQARLSAFFLA